MCVAAVGVSGAEATEPTSAGEGAQSGESGELCGRWTMNQVQGVGNREEGIGIVLVKRPVRRAETVRRVEAGVEVREGSTGRVVYVAPAALALVRPAVPVKGKLLMLPRVWAVAETADVGERLQPLPPFDTSGGVEAEAGDVGPIPGAADVAEAVPGEALPVGEVGPVWESAAGTEAVEDEPAEVLPVELAFYRRYTEAMLRRYVRLSISVGRVPSLLGRELFRGNVSSYRMTNFEDVVVFCFDMERLLGRMRGMDQQLIKRIGMQEYPQGEVASMLRISLRNCIRNYNYAIDRLTEMLLEAKLLEALERGNVVKGGKSAFSS
jgi:hypothetical protein